MSDPLKHWLYADARKFWQDVQNKQISKGLEKYPEPLNPDSWTIDELADHAVQENVDQMHYITALREKGRKLEIQNAILLEALEWIACYDVLANHRYRDEWSEAASFNECQEVAWQALKQIQGGETK